MGINWDASEIRIRLTPIGKPMNRAVKSMVVFKDYGDAKIRTVQAIANMLGGETVYFDAVQEVKKDPKKIVREIRQSVPVSGWRGTSNAPDCLVQVALFIEKAQGYALKVECYGATRARWCLELETSNPSKDVIDNMSDKGLAGDGKTRPVDVTEANGLRLEF